VVKGLRQLNLDGGDLVLIYIVWYKVKQPFVFNFFETSIEAVIFIFSIFGLVLVAIKLFLLSSAPIDLELIVVKA